MVIQLSPELEAKLLELARLRGIPADQLAAETLTQHLMAHSTAVVPSDEWEQRLHSIATNCGVALSDEACSGQESYD